MTSTSTIQNLEAVGFSQEFLKEFEKYERLLKKSEFEVVKIEGQDEYDFLVKDDFAIEYSSGTLTL